MTRQEEIRDGVELIVYDTIRRDEITDKLLVYLHSQGVVIKVEKELPQAGIRGLSGEEAEYKTDIWATVCEHMLLSGYVAVEPLIKEG